MRQFSRVRGTRRGKRVDRVTAFDHLALFQHRDPVGHVGHNGEVVRDQEEAHAALLHQAAKQVEDLRLEHHIQGCRGLVSNQELGPASDSDGDHHALPLAARHLVGIFGQPRAIRCQADTTEQLGRLL